MKNEEWRKENEEGRMRGGERPAESDASAWGGHCSSFFIAMSVTVSLFISQ
jgi:hypothetical protein